MSLMQPIRISELRENTDWIYEIKYDGFRVNLLLSDNRIKIISRNNKDLTANFPEIIQVCEKNISTIKKFLPIQLDGELAILNNAYQANFSLIQMRGRLKTVKKINEEAKSRPATLIAFDILQWQGKECIDKKLTERKKLLNQLFANFNDNRITKIKSYESLEQAIQIMDDYKAEGLVAKHKRSLYISCKSHHHWFKYKNWRTIHAFLTAYDSQNDYFEAAVYNEDQIESVGKCKHGLDKEAYISLKTIFIENGTKENGKYHLPPAICTSIHTLDFLSQEMREPEFHELLPGESAIECTKDRLLQDLSMLPDVGLSNLDKLFWPEHGYTKGNLLQYLREIYPYMSPYLYNRMLTVIRCPDGVKKECFFQKNLPTYAPSFINYIDEGDKRGMICNSLETLIWFGNHSVIEFHIPFQPVQSPYPNEIVFDLDPPSTSAFSLAMEAAVMIKEILDKIGVIPFIKTSGSKGLQIHIPIIENKMSYEDTAVFTEAIAMTVEQSMPNKFTTERMKKNRNERLYLDYVQHGKNKTIIAPYSPRKTETGTVATPLYWEELKTELNPKKFTIKTIVDRVKTMGCPWLNTYNKVRKVNYITLKKYIFSS